jgi:hypothetical protein
MQVQLVRDSAAFVPAYSGASVVEPYHRLLPAETSHLPQIDRSKATKGEKELSRKKHMANTADFPA